MIELAPRHKFGLPLASPVMPAAGAFGFGDTYHDLVDLRVLGALVTNPVSLMPREAARGARITIHGEHAAGGFVAHTGLPNPGVKRVLQQYRQTWERLPIPVIVHLIATTPAETAKAAERLSGISNVVGIELGLVDNITPQRALNLLDAACADGDLPVIVRVPFISVDALAPLLADHGADALTLVAPPRAVLPVSDAPEDNEARRYLRGRLYSTALFPLLLNVLARWCSKLPVPVIACGGIASLQDAIACLELGATALQVDALLWRDPAMLQQIAEGLAASDTSSN
jgi:dihydroorotate dehydrogenase (NAD+) catalytic subunit